MKRFLFLCSNFTTPSTTVNSVSSDARRTFSPGWNFVPRCLTRMLPAVTNSPAKRFTPKYLGPESRPLREEPTPFLWAIRSEEHTSELQSQSNLVCRLLLEKKKTRCGRESPERLHSRVCRRSSGCPRRRARTARRHQPRDATHDSASRRTTSSPTLSAGNVA